MTTRRAYKSTYRWLHRVDYLDLCNYEDAIECRIPVASPVDQVKLQALLTAINAEFERRKTLIVNAIED